MADMDFDQEVNNAMRDLERAGGSDGGPGMNPAPANVDQIIEEVARNIRPPLNPIADQPPPPQNVIPPLIPDPNNQIIRVASSALNTPFRQLVPVTDPRRGQVREVGPENTRRRNRQSNNARRNHQANRNRRDRAFWFGLGDTIFQLAQNRALNMGRGRRPRRGSQPSNSSANPQ